MTTIARELTPGQREALRLALLDGSSAVATVDDASSIAAAAAAEVGALLSRALPSGRVLHVGAGRDHTTLSAAYAALAALTGDAALSASNRYRLHLWGDIVETATIYAPDHVDLVFEDGARLIVENNFSFQPAIRWTDATASVVARVPGRAWIIRRPATGTTTMNQCRAIVSYGNGSTRMRFFGIVARADSAPTGGERNYAWEVSDADLDLCEGYGSGQSRAYGIFNGDRCTIRRSLFSAEAGGAGGSNMNGITPFASTVIEDCTFYAGQGTFSYGVGVFSGGAGATITMLRCTAYGGSSGTGPAGILLHPTYLGSARLIGCFGVGRATSGSESHGIWTQSYPGTGAKVELIRCVGIGGGSTASWGINAHKSAWAKFVDCIGVGGSSDGAGIRVNAQDNNHAHYEFHGCTGIGRGATNAPGLLLHEATRDLFSRCTFIGSSAAAAAGVIWEPHGSPGIVSPQRPTRLDSCTLYGGGAGETGQPAPTSYADSPALLVKLDRSYSTYTERLELVGCTLRSNSLSPAITIVGDANPWGIRCVGGYAASLDPATQPAIRAPLATPWADAEIYDMTLVGGVENVTVAATPTMLGTNRVL